MLNCRVKCTFGITWYLTSICSWDCCGHGHGHGRGRGHGRGHGHGHGRGHGCGRGHDSIPVTHIFV